MSSGSLEATDAASAAVQKTPHRVSLQDLNDQIGAEYYFTADKAILGAAAEAGKPTPPLVDALKIMTICVLVTKTGFVVVGKTAPADPNNFNAELGCKFAREDAVRQMWPLEGYLLRHKLATGG